MRKTAWVVRMTILGMACVSPVTAGYYGGPLGGYYNATFDIGTSGFGGEGILGFGFGSASAARFNNTLGHDSSFVSWSRGGFGADVRGSLDSTGAAQYGEGYVHALLEELMTVPSQPGLAPGDPGILQLNFHLDGVVTIDVGETFNGSGTLLSGGEVDVSWNFYYAPGNANPNAVLAASVNGSWSGNSVSAVMNRDIVVDIPFLADAPFYFIDELRLSAAASSGAPPSTGFAEGDFSHTGTLKGGVVLDGFGNPIANPILISESGFDFLDPKSSSVPEPAAGILVAGSLAGFLLARRRSWRISH